MCKLDTTLLVYQTNCVNIIWVNFRFHGMCKRNVEIYAWNVRNCIGTLWGFTRQKGAVSLLIISLKLPSRLMDKKSPKGKTTVICSREYITGHFEPRVIIECSCSAASTIIDEGGESSVIVPVTTVRTCKFRHIPVSTERYYKSEIFAAIYCYIVLPHWKPYC